MAQNASSKVVWKWQSKTAFVGGIIAMIIGGLVCRFIPACEAGGWALGAGFLAFWWGSLGCPHFWGNQK